jgi:hypothetical protein
MADTKMNSNSILVGLAKSAEILAKEMQMKVSGGGYPHDLAGSIVIGSPINVGGNTYMITIGVRHPAGAAYEYGSGIHAEFGMKEKYPIVADDKLLTFPFTLTFMPGSKFAGMKGYTKKRLFWQLQGDHGQVGGTTYWHNVDHPGVEGRPYARPAIQTKKKEIVKVLGKAFVASIVATSSYRVTEIKVEARL